MCIRDSTMSSVDTRSSRLVFGVHNVESHSRKLLSSLEGHSKWEPTVPCLSLLIHPRESLLRGKSTRTPCVLPSSLPLHQEPVTVLGPAFTKKRHCPHPWRGHRLVRFTVMNQKLHDTRWNVKRDVKMVWEHEVAPTSWVGWGRLSWGADCWPLSGLECGFTEGGGKLSLIGKPKGHSMSQAYQEVEWDGKKKEARQKMKWKVRWGQTLLCSSFL